MCDGSLARKQRLRFSHKSLSDWLGDEKNESYHVEEREGHELLARTCIDALRDI